LFVITGLQQFICYGGDIELLLTCG